MKSNLAYARSATSAVFFANGFGVGGWAAAVAPFKAHFALSNGQLGLVLLALAAGAVSFMPIAGLLAPKLGGTGRATSRAGLVYGAAIALAGLAPTAVALAATGLLLGAANGVMDVSMNAHASDVERRWASPIMSSFHAAFSVGGLAGAGLGAGLLSLGASYGQLLLTTGAVAFVLVAISSVYVGEGDRPKVRGTGLGWPPRALSALAAIAFFCFLVEGAMIDWDGVYLASIGASPALATIGYASFSAVMVLGRFLGDRLIALWGRPRIVLGGAAIAAIGLALAAGSPGWPAAVLGFALVGAGLSNVVPALFSQSASHASSPARGIAAVATAGYTGLLLGPALVGAIATAGGLRIAFASLAAMAGIAVALSLSVRRD